MFIDTARLTPEATFHGSIGEYLGLNNEVFSDHPIWFMVSSSETYELSLRTRAANGLLLFTSDEYEDHLAITMRDAGITLTIRLSGIVHEINVKPSKTRFDDNQWHSVVVTRKIREVTPEYGFTFI